MAHTVISAKYPPLIDPTRATIAYGDRALPRLVNKTDFIYLTLSSSKVKRYFNTNWTFKFFLVVRINLFEIIKVYLCLFWLFS